MAARPVLDEFTAPAEKAALLERSRGRIEGLFGVGLAVLGALGAEEPLPARIWLQLRGAQEAVHSAKVSAARPGPGRPLRPRDPRPGPGAPLGPSDPRDRGLGAPSASGSRAMGAWAPRSVPGPARGLERSVRSRRPVCSAHGPCDLG